MRTYWSSGVTFCLRVVPLVCVAVFALSVSQAAAMPSTASSPLSLGVQAELEASNVSVAEAKANLAVQHQASRVDLVGQLEEELGRDYASVWFDNEAGEFVVPIATAGDGRAVTEAGEIDVQEEFASAALDDDFRVEVVRYSMGELEAAQDELSRALAPYLEGKAVRSAIDSEGNAVEIRIPSDLSAASLAKVESLTREANVATRLVALEPRALEAGPASCDESRRLCDLPVRGGVAMYGGPAWPGPHGEELEEVCSVGFRANGYDGHKYIVTAGHCAKREENPSGPTNWSWKTTSVSSQDNHYIGSTSQFHYPGKDWAKIDATGTWADTPPWPTQIAYWGSTYEYPVAGEARAYVGETLCHIGMNTGTSCGIVVAEGVRETYAEGTPIEAQMNGLFEVTGSGLALGGGDSGGPVVANNVALGVVSGGIQGFHNATLYFNDITEATAELNVNIAGPGITEAITGGVSSVGTNSATVSGQVDPHGAPTEFTVEWGQGGYEHLTSYSSVGQGQGFVPVSKTITGLEPAMTYKYRVTAANGFGEAHGAEGSFTTAPAPPLIYTEPAESVRKSSASLGASIWTQGSPTSYQVEYGTTAAYGTAVPASPEGIGAGRTPVRVRQSIGGLKEATTYHFRVKATNAGGTSFGPDTTFTTPDKPAVTAEAASYVNTLEPQLNATVGPERADTTYQFEYGTTTSYGTKVPIPPGEILASWSPTRVERGIKGLARNTTYHYRVTAENEVGITRGADRTFTTLPPCKGAEAKCLWSLQEASNPAPSERFELKGISCASATSCVAVGKNLYDGKSFVDRWNGTSWSLFSGTVTGDMKHLSCVAQGCFVVGTGGGVPQTWWVGELTGIPGWVVYPSTPPLPSGATEAKLVDVECLSSSACTAVGSFKSAKGAYRPLVERWNGSAWVLESAPNPAEGTAQNAMLSVTCNAYGCFTVGEAAGRPTSEVWSYGTWSLTPSPTLPAGAKGGTLSAVSCNNGVCVATGNYYEVAGQEKALAETWNGANWTLMGAPTPAAAKGFVELAGVSCPTATSCTAAGYYAPSVSGGAPTELKTLTESWNGSAWTIQTSPNAAQRYNLLTDISCTSASACAAVGESSPGVNQNPESLAEGWNGTAWSTQTIVNPELPNETELKSVSCSSNTSCVGAGKDLFADKGFLEVWNGTGWTVNSTFAGEMRKISCTAEGCVAVGVSGGAAQTWLVFKTGGAWAVTPTAPASPPGATETSLAGVSCTGSSSCTAVGSYKGPEGTYHPLVERWNGNAWVLQSAPDPAEGTARNAMLAVSCADSSTCVAVGEAAGKPVAQRWNGSTWTGVGVPTPSGAKGATLVGISCGSARACTAVGDSYEGTGSEKALVERWNGTNWVISATPTPAGAKGFVNLTDVSCLSPNACFAAGYYAPEVSGTAPTSLKTLVESWDGSSWTVLATPNLASQTFNSLAGISCTTSIDCTAVGGAASSFTKRPPVQVAMRFE